MKTCVSMCQDGIEDVDGICGVCADDPDMRINGLIYLDDYKEEMCVSECR